MKEYQEDIPMNLFEFIKSKALPQQQKIEKPVIVCIHGFGVRQKDEFTNLITYFNDYEISIPYLFNLLDESDTDWTQWMSRAEKILDDLATQGRRIILVGFSMGGVIATYFSTKPNVDKLILIAPAFEFINLSNAASVLSSFLDKKPDAPVPSQYPEMPVGFTLTFSNLVTNCRSSISDVHIPTLIFHGSEDDVIMNSSSRKYFKKINVEDKALCIIEGSKHRILDDEINGRIVLENIRLFIDDKIVTKK